MLWYIFIFLICLLTFVFGLTLYIYGNDDYWPKHGVPFVKGSDIAPFWDRLLIKIPFHLLDSAVYNKLKAMKNVKFGGIMEFRRPLVFLMDLELIRHVLVKDFDHFTNRRPFGSSKELFGKMLFNMPNPPWKDTRAVMSPTFTTGKIRRMFQIFAESGDKMVNFVKCETSKSTNIEMRDVCGRYTMDVIASAAFGVDSQNFKDKNSIFVRMGHRVQNQFSGFGIFKAFLSILLPGLFEFLNLELMDKTCVNFFADVITKAIKHRESTGERRNDFLQLLMDSRSGNLEVDDDDLPGDSLTETNENTAAVKPQAGIPQEQKSQKMIFTDELIIAQCVLFFMAGFDTTETLLIYACYELALNPDVQEHLSKELENAIEINGGKLTYDVVTSCDYLDMVISETLRKYPPVTRTERKCTKEYKFPDSDYEVKKETILAIPVWPIHYDPDIYPDPEKFIPERFNKENKLARHPYAYSPFGLGPRNCIAMRFALTEGKTAVAHLVHNFMIQPCAKTTIPMEYSTDGNLKPVKGMWLNVTPRK